MFSLPALLTTRIPQQSDFCFALVVNSYGHPQASHLYPGPAPMYPVSTQDSAGYNRPGKSAAFTSQCCFAFLWCLLCSFSVPDGVGKVSWSPRLQDEMSYPLGRCAWVRLRKALLFKFTLFGGAGNGARISHMLHEGFTSELQP